MIPFTKMQGIGNDFVMVDTLQDELPEIDIASLARAINDRRLGVGGDGLILMEKGETAPFKMRMFNPDGSESEMCGNGIRCFVRLLKDHNHLAADTVSVETGAGTLNLELKPSGLVTVDMGIARLTRGEIGMTGPSDERFVEQPVDRGWLGTAVSMGNPHLVVFLEDVKAIDLRDAGSRLENLSIFTNRTNVHFVQVLSRNSLLQRTWERGAGATLACGTGACACAVAATLTGRSDRDVEVQLPGGSLQLRVAEDWRVFMTGPAETVFEGVWQD